MITQTTEYWKCIYNDEVLKELMSVSLSCDTCSKALKEERYVIDYEEICPACAHDAIMNQNDKISYIYYKKHSYDFLADAYHYIRKLRRSRKINIE
jgi:hypothetical protein